MTPGMSEPGASPALHSSRQPLSARRNPRGANARTIPRKFHRGAEIWLRAVRVGRERIKTFAAEIDPQPIHLDEEAARDAIFRGLAASGLHTAARAMRLVVESEFKPAGGFVGAGVDQLRWPPPVRPGDELRVESEILEVRPSKSHPQQGLQGTDDNAEPQLRGRVGFRRQSDRAAPRRVRISVNQAVRAGKAPSTNSAFAKPENRQPGVVYRYAAAGRGRMEINPS